MEISLAMSTLAVWYRVVQSRYVRSRVFVFSVYQFFGILCLEDLLERALCKNFFYFHMCSFFWFSNMILSDALILPISQLQTQKVMTSQNRSHIEYLIQTYYILMLIL